MRVVRALIALALAIGLAACGNKPMSPTRPRSTAKIAIVQPQAGVVITGKAFTVKMTLTGGRIIKVVSTQLTPNEGHVHLSLDGKIQTMTFGLTQSLKTPSKGSHILQAEFVAKDHGPFSPRVLSAVPIKVA